MYVYNCYIIHTFLSSSVYLLWYNIPHHWECMKAVKLLIRYSNAVCQEYFIVYFKCSLGIIIIAIDIAIYVSPSTFHSKTEKLLGWMQSLCFGTSVHFNFCKSIKKLIKLQDNCWKKSFFLFFFSFASAGNWITVWNT